MPFANCFIGLRSCNFFIILVLLANFLKGATAWMVPTIPMFYASRSMIVNAITRNLPKNNLNSAIRKQRNAFVYFGSKAGVPGNPPGTISIYNEQDALQAIDEEALRKTIHRISQLIGYETYDVTLLLVDDEEMRETNLESRGIDAPTDILSFPFHDYVQAGELVEPAFDIPDYYTLGDLVVDVPYVIRRCKEDQEDADAASYSDSEYEEENRGVSGAMASIYDPEKRIHMLLVHGMLHLVGHDHEEDDEFELMVTREEEVLKELGLFP